MLSMEAKRKCRKMVEDCDDNYGELLKLIEAETQHMQDMLKAHRKTDIFREFKSNISFERSYELSMYIVELASKEIQRSARRSQSRNAKDYINYIMNYKALMFKDLLETVGLIFSLPIMPKIGQKGRIIWNTKQYLYGRPTKENLLQTDSLKVDSKLHRTLLCRCTIKHANF